MSATCKHGWAKRECLDCYSETFSSTPTWRSCASKPSREGVYRRRQRMDEEPLFALWDGAHWRAGQEFQERAAGIAMRSMYDASAGEWLDESNAAPADSLRDAASSSGRGSIPDSTQTRERPNSESQSTHSLPVAAPVDQRQCRHGAIGPCEGCEEENFALRESVLDKPRAPAPFKPYRDPRFGLLVKWPSARERRPIEGCGWVIRAWRMR